MHTHSILVALTTAALSFACSPLDQPQPSTAPVKPTEKQPATTPAAPSASKPRDDAAAESLGWKLGVQAWTFRDRTTEEAIDTARSLGIKYMQLYQGQVVSKSKPDVKVGPEMSEADRNDLKKKLRDAGIDAMSFGVVGFKNEEASARKMFEFAQAMGFKTIAAEPDEDAWSIIEKLADEFDIRVACHDHPKPSRYWNPETVLASIKGRSKRLGACADTGHWKRSGLDPVQCLHSLKGHIFELHFKDIADNKDRPWGTGSCNAKAMLEALRAQDFKGCVFIEYEDGAGKELDANVAKCVEFFDATAREVAGAKRK